MMILMKVLRVPIADADFAALRDLAYRDRRDPRMQARVIIEREIAGRRESPQDRAAAGGSASPSST